jgi:signal transduction histidine kinase
MLRTRDVRDTDQLRQLAIVAHELRNPPAAAACALRGLLRSQARVPEMHGGRIEASSGGIGLGSRFSVVLPLASGTFKAEE